MENCELIYDMPDVSYYELDALFAEVKVLINTAVENQWLPSRNNMYIQDIQDMCFNQHRFKDAGDNINTILEYIQENESNALSEKSSRELMAKLGELQTNLHKASSYYN